MNKEAILKAFGGSEEDFYKLYPTEDHFKKAMGGAFETYTSDVPDFFNPQFIMDIGGNVASPMNYGAFPVMKRGGDMPCYNCGGSYMQQGGINPTYQNLDNEGRPIQGGLMWNPETGETLKDPLIQPIAPLQINGVQSPSLNPVTQSSVGVNFNTANTGNARRSFGILGAKPGQILDANTNRLKKHGGSADQGMSQDDVLQQKKDTFLNFIQGNTQKALMKEMHEEMMGEMLKYGGLPKAADGHNLTESEWAEYQRLKNSNTIPYTQSYNPHAGYTGMNYFPMNTRQSWHPGKKDFETLNSLSKDAKLTGYKANYGPLGRLAPKLFGPKSYEFNFSDINPATSQHPGVNLLDKNNPLHDPNKDVSTPAQAGSLYQSSKPAMNWGIKPFGIMEYGGIPEFQEGSSVLGKPSSPYMTLPSIDLVGPGSTQSSQNFPSTFVAPQHPDAGKLNNIEMKDYGQNPADRVNKSVKINRKNEFNGEEVANWLLAGMSNTSSLLEGKDRRAAEERMEALQSGDNQFYATQGNRGDYDVNTGMFRVDQTVPVQFSGANLMTSGQTNYQFGGANEEELELTDEEIAAIEAAGGEVEYLD